MNGSMNERWLDDEDHRSLVRDVLAPDPAQAPVDVRERLQPGAHQPVDDRVDALGAGAGVQRVCGPWVAVDSSSPISYTDARRARYSRTSWPSTAPAPSEALLPAPPPRPSGPRSSRSTSASSAASTTTSSCSGASSPRGRAAYPVGLAMHIANGALFGAAYANASRALPMPGVAARAVGRVGRAPGDLAGHRRAVARAPGRATSCRSCGAPAARSRRPPGATCCSAPCWASSSGA